MLVQEVSKQSRQHDVDCALTAAAAATHHTRSCSTDCIAVQSTVESVFKVFAVSQLLRKVGQYAVIIQHLMSRCVTTQALVAANAVFNQKTKNNSNVQDCV